MPSTDAIWNAVSGAISIRKGRFRLAVKSGTDPSDSDSELNAGDILLPFIEHLDTRWQFETEPDARTVGSIVEILRACRFFSAKRGEIEIIPDKRQARMQGAYDTPEPIVKYLTESVLAPLCKSKNPPTVLDPACGAGYFILSALDFLIDKYPDDNPVSLVESNLRGLDIEPVALALTRRNLARHVDKIHGVKIPSSILENSIILADALDTPENLPVKLNSFDAVIGNPPYQFYSGRGSPVAAFKHEGKHKEAKILANEIKTLTDRFPLSSHGCRDRYKWFIDRATQFLQTGGRLGFITPNTWLAYPRYRDIRCLLGSNGRIEQVIDFGSLAFDRAHVPAATLLWTRSTVRPNSTFPLSVIEKTTWEQAIDGDRSVIKESVANAPESRFNKQFDIVPVAIENIKSGGTGEPVKALLENPYNQCRVPLSEVAVIREGSHAIRAVGLNAAGKPHGSCSYPVLVDKKMGPLTSPGLGYIEKTDKAPEFSDQHSGPRFLLRKTGDSLVVAPSPTDEFALAHQNVYVCKPIGQAVTFHALLGILASELMTDLYRAGPGGQHGRPLAQFRIHFLNRLPIVIVPKMSKAGSSEISLLLEKISNVTREIIDCPDKSLKQKLDRLVYDLYSESTAHNDNA